MRSGVMVYTITSMTISRKKGSGKQESEGLRAQQAAGG